MCVYELHECVCVCVCKGGVAAKARGIRLRSPRMTPSVDCWIHLCSTRYTCVHEGVGKGERAKSETETCGFDLSAAFTKEASKEKRMSTDNGCHFE